MAEFTDQNGVRYEWDDYKSELNKAKHGIDLPDAIPAFSDEWAKTREDPDHPEDRWVILGSGRYLMVVVAAYTYRTNSIRIISVRRANRSERKSYERGR